LTILVIVHGVENVAKHEAQNSSTAEALQATAAHWGPLRLGVGASNGSAKKLAGQTAGTNSHTQQTLAGSIAASTG